MTYRRVHHSTSDDSSRYRPKDKLGTWTRPDADPISRLRKFLQSRKIIDNIDAKKEEIREDARREVSEAIKIAEKQKRAAIKYMFEEIVYAEILWHLKEQKEYLLALVQGNKDMYHLERFEQDKVTLAFLSHMLNLAPVFVGHTTLK
jgi:2-oxoisovalerate dehydrogenase E1 component alpha subunit